MLADAIKDMLQRGESYRSIGVAVGRTGEGVAAIAKQGVIPAWDVGNAIIALHKRVMRKYPKIKTAA